MGGGYVGHAGGELRRQHAPAGSTRQQEARANARLCTRNAGTPTNVRVLQHARKCFITHKHKARKSSKRDGERRWGRGKRNKRVCVWGGDEEPLGAEACAHESPPHARAPRPSPSAPRAPSPFLAPAGQRTNVNRSVSALWHCLGMLEWCSLPLPWNGVAAR